MNIIGIIPNLSKDRDLKYTTKLIEAVRKNSGKYVVTKDIACKIGLKNGVTNESELIDNSDVIICLGGDGTFLSVARKVYAKNKPILGINLGTLGFLTEIEKSDIKDFVQKILNNDFEIEERMMLQAEIVRNNRVETTDIALNDIVISRIALSRIVHLRTYINDVYVDSFPGDGLIVASPTGSTAYSLSAGGPIIEPDIDLMVITPICPHILYSRSFITTGDRVVKVQIDNDYDDKAMVTIDGQKGIEVSAGDEVRIKKASYYVKMIKLHERNFFSILRSKIYFRGDRDEIQ